MSYDDGTQTVNIFFTVNGLESSLEAVDASIVQSAMEHIAQGA